MKPLYIVQAILCLIITILLFENNSNAQCANNQPEQHITYDTSVLGTGNNEFVFTFPQFDPTIGTLNAVKLETLVTLLYSFQLENNNVTSAEQKVRITRTDEISYSGDLVEKTNNKNLGPYHLAGSDGVAGSGPDYVEDGPLFAFQDLLNTYNITADVVPFLGNSTIGINYNTYSFANAVGNLNSNLSGQAQDFINFKITYSYCPIAILAVDIMDFTATKLPTGDIQLSWLTPNDYAEKKYEIEKSADGRTFKHVQSLVTGNITSTGKQVLYTPVTEDKNKLFFRIKQLETDGSVKFSAIRQVTLDAGESSIRVFPTLATNGINIYIPPNIKSDFKVSIISTTGQVVQQSEFSKTNIISMPFNRKLPAGLYIIAVYNKKTMEYQQSKIMVQ